MEARLSPIDSRIIAALRKARKVVCLTGAGVSAESGIPTFRDKQTGLWEQFDAAQLATPYAFQRDPSLVWGWYESRRAAIRAATPNAAHYAIAALARLIPQFTLITQNVDDLHERSGSSSVLHLHGELSCAYCEACRRPYSHPEGMPPTAAGGGRIDPPTCEFCGAKIRPGVVWFGEGLPQREWHLACEAATRCEVLLCVGTSSVVQPAASLLDMAIEAGAMTFQVNPNATDYDNSVTMSIRGAAGLVLPRLVEDTWNAVLDKDF